MSYSPAIFLGMSLKILLQAKWNCCGRLVQMIIKFLYKFGPLGCKLLPLKWALLIREHIVVAPLTVRSLSFACQRTLKLSMMQVIVRTILSNIILIKEHLFAKSVSCQQIRLTDMVSSEVYLHLHLPIYFTLNGFMIL